jgi:tetratricopeptide (TPR) repeat protein
MAEQLIAAKVAKLRALASSASTADEAVRHLNAALYLQPNSVNLLVDRSDALLRLGDVASAIANVRHAMQLAESAAEAQTSVCSQKYVSSSTNHLVDLHATAKGDGSDAWARAELQERLAGLLDLRAAALMQAGEQQAAVPYLKEAIELMPHRSSYRMHRALAYTGCNEPILALRDLNVRRIREKAQSAAGVCSSPIKRNDLLPTPSQFLHRRARTTAAATRRRLTCTFCAPSC